MKVSSLFLHSSTDTCFLNHPHGIGPDTTPKSSFLDTKLRFEDDVFDAPELGDAGWYDPDFKESLQNDASSEVEDFDVGYEKWGQEDLLTPEQKAQREQIVALLLSYPHVEYPDGAIKVMQDVELAGYDQVTSLPEGISFGKNLVVKDCEHLTELASILTVDGDMKLANCPNMVSLRSQVFVQGSLTITHMDQLLQLPKGLRIEKDLQISNCRKLRHLNGFGHVEGDLRVDNCQALGQLGPSFHVGQDISIFACPKFFKLPENLNVRGNLWIEHCPALCKLPENILILGNLFLDNLERLRALPMLLQIGGHLRARSLQLDSIPHNIFHLGKTDLGLPRVVDLRYTQLPLDIYSRIKNYAEPTQSFLFDKHEAEYTLSKRDLQFWIEFWLSEYQCASLASVGQINANTWGLSREEQKQIGVFLSRLVELPDYNASKTRYEFKQKVWILLLCLQAGRPISRIICNEVGTASLGTINDVILKFNQLEVFARIQIGLLRLGSLDTSRKLALSVLRKSLIAKYVKRRCAEKTSEFARQGKLFSGDADLLLSFEIALQEKFILPGTAKLMVDAVDLSEQDIMDASDYVESSLKREDLIRDFSNRWDRWIQALLGS